MFRITNLTPVYKKDGTIIEYRASVENRATDGNSVSANTSKNERYFHSDQRQRRVEL